MLLTGAETPPPEVLDPSLLNWCGLDRTEAAESTDETREKDWGVEASPTEWSTCRGLVLGVHEHDASFFGGVGS